MQIPTLRETSSRQPQVEMGAMWQHPAHTPLLSTVKPCASLRTTTALRKKHNLSSPRKAPAVVCIWTEDGPEILKSTEYGGEEQWIL
jgi:hypothetical protein